MTDSSVTHIVVTGTARWRRRSVDGYLMASCAALKILVWGESEEELESKQHHAVCMAILHLHSHGILEPFLEDRGFSVSVTEGSIGRDAIEPRSPGHFPTRSGPHVHLPLKYAYA